MQTALPRYEQCALKSSFLGSLRNSSFAAGSDPIHAWNRVEVIRGRKIFPWVLGALVAQTISVSMLVLAIFWHTSIGENYSAVRSVVIGSLVAFSTLSALAALWRSEIRFDLGFSGTYLSVVWLWLGVASAFR
jgi:hypothetical protein